MSKRPDDQLQAAFDAARAEAEPMPTDEQVARARTQFLSTARGENVSPNGVARLTEQESALPDVTVAEEKQMMSHRTLHFVRLAAAALLGVIVVGGLLWASPALRALAQEIINFIVQGESDNRPTSFYVPQNPYTYDTEYVSPYQLTLDEVAAQADFNIRVPTFMIPSFRLAGGTYDGETQRAELQYDCIYKPYGLLITQQHDDSSVLPIEVGASAVIEEIPIRDAIAQYVPGSWRVEVDSTLIQEPREDVEFQMIPATLVWSNEVDYHRLYWREDDINFAIQSSMGSYGHPNPCALTKEDYVAIAEGLKPASEVIP